MFYPHVILEEEVSQLEQSLVPSMPTPHGARRASSPPFPSLPRPWLEDRHWMIDSSQQKRHRDYLTACSEGAMAGSLLTIAVEELVCRLGGPGPGGFINPTAVPGRGHSLLLSFIPFAVLIQHVESAGITSQGHRALAACQAGTAAGSSSSASSQAVLMKRRAEAVQPRRCRQVPRFERRWPGGCEISGRASPSARNLRATFSLSPHPPAQSD